MNKRAIALCGLLLAACARGQGLDPLTGPATFQPAPPSPSPTPSIAVVSSRYGAFEIKTRPLERCDLEIHVNAGTFADGPPKALAGTADATGRLTWSYPTPLVPSGLGRHVVACSDAQGHEDTWSEFSVALKNLEAKGFTARLQAVDPISGLEGVSTKLDPSQVLARDAAMKRLTDTLAKEWTIATRGLGALTLVESSADIVLYVLPGRSSSLHLTAHDGTQRILLYTVDELGQVSPENTVATALHELGHIWCCSGPDAGADGHWLEKVADPLLQGIDRFGLMTHPVTCLVGRGFQSCPNRFSERELRTMGFTSIPAPPPDPCVTQANAIKVRLATAGAAIDAEKKQAAEIAAQIDAIEAQYPSRQLPPDVYVRYMTLVDQYNRLADDIDVKVTAYNRDVNALNALPC